MISDLDRPGMISDARPNSFCGGGALDGDELVDAALDA